MGVLGVFLLPNGGPEGFALFRDALHFRLFFRDLLLQSRNGGGGLFHEASGLLLALRLGLHVLGQTLNGLLIQFDGVLRDRDFRISFRDLLFIAGSRQTDLLDLQGDGPGRLCRRFRVRLDFDEGFLRSVVLALGRFDFPLLFLEAVLQIVDGVKPERDLQLFFLFCQNEELLGLFRLGLQGAHPGFQLCQYIAKTDQVFFRPVEAAHGLLAAVTEVGNARSLFQHIAAVRRLR